MVVHLSTYARIVVIIVLIVSTVGAIGIYSQSLINHDSHVSGAHKNECQQLLNEAPGVATSSTNSSVATFTVIESDTGPYEGINGSALHMSTPWPVMVVHKGQEVVIHIYNCASSEAHGFAIDYYFNLGVTVHEGQSFVETFLATTPGNFTVYCNVFCAIHPLMQNGRLTVLS